MRMRMRMRMKRVLMTLGMGVLLTGMAAAEIRAGDSIELILKGVPAAGGGECSIGKC